MVTCIHNISFIVSTAVFSCKTPYPTILVVVPYSVVLSFSKADHDVLCQVHAVTVAILMLMVLLTVLHGRNGAVWLCVC